MENPTIEREVITVNGVKYEIRQRITAADAIAAGHTNTARIMAECKQVAHIYMTRPNGKVIYYVVDYGFAYGEKYGRVYGKVLSVSSL